ncbi:hypothetical protein [Curtobacterium sp. SGAir0471]|uniref:hypothetical protein n=1 Tax=Curtobacterium sp. SGAir0471 TaxID=2070337 RepID=UPI0010F9B426|nr:hypothetical protein [Curtobacterium sp. SGAir0471]
MDHKTVDERDTEWETATPRLRAFFWTNGRSHLDCVEISGATIRDASTWARDEAERRGAKLQLAILSADEAGLPGLIWLTDGGGADA